MQQLAMKTMRLVALSYTRKASHDDELEQSREALPKNLICPLPVQDHKDGRFRRPALPIAGARRRSGWRSYEGGASMRRGKTLGNCVVSFGGAYGMYL